MKTLAIALSGLLLLGSLGCAGKDSRARTPQETFPANMEVYPQPIEQVWAALLNVIRYDMLYSLAVIHNQDHFFSTELVRDEHNGTRYKFRISGTLKFEGNGAAVVLYKQQEALVNGQWMTQPSDYQLERQILNRVAQRLRSEPAANKPSR